MQFSASPTCVYKEGTVGQVIAIAILVLIPVVVVFCEVMDNEEE